MVEPSLKSGGRGRGSVGGSVPTGQVQRAFKTKAELVYEYLRDSILRGELRPGQRIVLDKAAEVLGVSKVPVREAVTRLVGEGWVVLQPHIGPVVPSLSVDEVVETAVMRAALEGAAIELSVPEMSPDLLKSVRSLLYHMDRALRDPRTDFPALNRQFHAMMIASCGFRHLIELTDTLMGQTVRYQTVRRVPQYLARSQAEHWEILNAASKGKVALASDLTKSHILSASYRLRDEIGAQVLDRDRAVSKGSP